MFSKIVAIEPVSLIPSAEEALHTFANEVVMYPDIPADDEEIVRRIGDADAGAAELYFEYPPRGNGKMSQYQIYRHVLFALLTGKRQRRYHLCQRARYQGHRYPGLWRRRSSRICHQRTGTLLPRVRPAGLGRRGS